MRTHVIVGYAYAKRVEKEDRFHGFDTAKINNKTYALVPEDAFTEQIRTFSIPLAMEDNKYGMTEDGPKIGDRVKRVIVETEWQAVEA